MVGISIVSISIVKISMVSISIVSISMDESNDTDHPIMRYGQFSVNQSEERGGAKLQPLRPRTPNQVQ